MIAQDQLTHTSYTVTKAPSFVSGERPNGPIGPFLKEAVQILIQASRTVSTPRYNNNNHTNAVINPTTTSYPDTASHNAENTTDTQRRQREDPSGDTVTWKLNLTPTLMTLDTNIQTVAGLVQVLGQLFANVEPQPILTNSTSSSSTSSSSACSTSSPPPPSTPSQPFTSNLTATVSSDQYQMYGIIHAIGEALRLSQVLVIPQTDVFRQVNTIQLMKQCVQVFIMCDNGAFFMNVPELMSKTDLVLSTANVFNNSSNNDDNGEYALDTLLLLSICCMMIRHVMVHRRGHTAVSAGLAHAFYTHARVRLQELFDVPHITVLRSIFLLSVFPHGPMDIFSTARLSSTLLTSATRMTLAMNLHHLDDSNITKDELDSDEKERRRRLAWMILCADHFSSMNRTGHSGLIDVNQWHVDFPSTLPDEQQRQPSIKRRVELFSQYCRIIMIRKMELFRSAYMVVSQSNKALASSMDQKLFDTYTSTPDHLRLELDLDEDHHLTRQWTKKDDLEPLLLESLHCNSLIMALVPFLPRRYLATFEQGALSREAGIKDIYQLMKHQASVSNCSITPSPPPTLFYNPKQQRNHPSHEDSDLDSVELEMHTVINCLTAANRLSFILEILEGVDPMYCHHQPTHPGLLLAYVYDMIQTNCQHSKVAMLCRLNLIRLQRLVRHTRLVDPDLTLVYLERILTSYITSPTDDPSELLERSTAAILLTLRQQHCLDETIKSEPPT